MQHARPERGIRVDHRGPAGQPADLQQEGLRPGHQRASGQPAGRLEVKGRRQRAARAHVAQVLDVELRLPASGRGDGICRLREVVAAADQARVAGAVVVENKYAGGGAIYPDLGCAAAAPVPDDWNITSDTTEVGYDILPSCESGRLEAQLTSAHASFTSS